MEDANGKCLLDVISDPAALNEFLRSNSQAAASIGQSLSQVKPSAFSTAINHSLTTSPLMSVTGTSALSIARVSVPQSTNQTVPQVNVESVRSNPAVLNGTANIGHSVMHNIARTNSVSPSRSIMNHNKPGNNVHTNAKAAVVTPVTFQGKKPIPIQPRNPVLLPATNASGTGGIQGNVLKGLHVVRPTGAASPNQPRLPQPNIVPRTTVSASTNGVETSSQQIQNLGLNIRNQTPGNQILNTPPKRIAPKQRVISPPSNSPSKVQKLIQMQSPRPTPQKMQVVSPLIQVQGAAQGTSTNVTQLLPQQLLNVVRQQQPQQIVQSVQASAPIQLQAAVTKPVQHIQQIEQLVQQKLNNQQTPVQVQQQGQQKVFTPAQLQAALKQTKLLTQSTGGQQPSLQVQQQILKQLLLLQHRPQEKPQQLLTVQQSPQQQPSAIQQLQQQVKLSTQQIVTHPQTSINLGNQQVQTVNQLVSANQVGAGNQQVVTRLLAPSQTRVINQNANQQQVTLGKSILTPDQQGIAVNQLFNQKQMPVTLGQQGTTQSYIVVSQPQLVNQQNALNTKYVTTSGTQLQTLVDQQQKQLQQILAQSRTLSQPVISIAGNVPQVNQNKLVQSIGGSVASTNQAIGQVQAVQGQQIIQTSTQQSMLIQPKPATTVSQPVTQALTMQQLQQLQNTSGVQKVFIIKQPELLQKLGMQGLKPQQTIQITPQQLQALRQMQSQMVTTQKGPVTTKIQTNTQTKLLTTQHLKQLQALQQQQAAAGTKVGTPTLAQTQQTLLQKQVLAQQLQKQLQGSKTQPKTTSHLPRILQTSGRQPVTSSQASHIKSSVKQEPNRGVKRTHPETPEPPKVVTRIKTSLSQDQHAVLHPDVHTPFKSVADATSKLIHYHVYNEPHPTPKEAVAADALFNAVATQLIKRSDKMMDKYRQLVLEESMRNEPSSEMVMLYRVFLADERADLAQLRLKATEDLKALEAAALIRQQEPASQPPVTMNDCIVTTSLPTCTTTTTAVTVDHDIIKEKEDSTKQSPMEITIDNSLLEVGEDEEVADLVSQSEESEVDKAVHNMESSSSFYMGLEQHDKLSVVDSPKTNPATPVGLECAEEMELDDEGEKEDVTATLALLHSMAEELDDTIS